MIARVTGLAGGGLEGLVELGLQAAAELLYLPGHGRLGGGGAARAGGSEPVYVPALLADEALGPGAGPVLTELRRPRRQANLTPEEAREVAYLAAETASGHADLAGLDRRGGHLHK